MLGLNVPFIQDGRLILRTLGMREIYVRHTGQNLKDTVMEILASYGITRDQILSVTTDNGRNMLTAMSKVFVVWPILFSWKFWMKLAPVDRLINRAREVMKILKN